MHKILNRKVKIPIVFLLAPILIALSIFCIRIFKRGNYSVIEKEGFLPDAEIFRRLSFNDKKYTLITFFLNYCDACKEGRRRQTLNIIASKYSSDIEVVGIFKDFSEQDLDNLKHIYTFSFKLYSSKENFVFREKNSPPFIAHPFSVLVDRVRKVIFMENKNQNFALDFIDFLSRGM